MDIPMVAIPVRCPKCGASGLAEFPVVVVAIALVKWNNMCLYAPCHGGGWDAGAKEMEAIRQHLGRDWIRRHGQAFLEPHPANTTFLDRSDRECIRKIPAGQVAGARRNAAAAVYLQPRSARDLN
jgi:hypothetical protein